MSQRAMLPAVDDHPSVNLEEDGLDDEYDSNERGTVAATSAAAALRMNSITPRRSEHKRQRSKVKRDLFGAANKLEVAHGEEYTTTTTTTATATRAVTSNRTNSFIVMTSHSSEQHFYNQNSCSISDPEHGGREYNDDKKAEQKSYPCHHSIQLFPATKVTTAVEQRTTLESKVLNHTIHQSPSLSSSSWTSDSSEIELSPVGSPASCSSATTTRRRRLDLIQNKTKTKDRHFNNTANNYSTAIVSNKNNQNRRRNFKMALGWKQHSPLSLPISSQQQTEILSQQQQPRRRKPSAKNNTSSNSNPGSNYGNNFCDGACLDSVYSYVTSSTSPSSSSSSSNSSQTAGRRLAMYAQRFLIGFVLLRFVTYCIWIHNTLTISTYTLNGSSLLSSNNRFLADLPASFEEYTNRPRELHQQDLDMLSSSSSFGDRYLPSYQIRQRQQSLHSNQFTQHARALHRIKRTRPRTYLPIITQYSASVSMDPFALSDFQQEPIQFLNFSHPNTLGGVSGEQKLALMANQTLNSKPQHEWSALCAQAGLNRKSKLILTGIFSQPPAMAFALIVSKHCNVHSIMGIDSLFPNRRRERMRYMDDYRLLQRRIANFQLVVPTKTGLTRDGKSLQNLLQFQATHVLCMETALPRHWWQNMDIGKLRLYQTQQSINSLQELLEVASLMLQQQQQQEQPQQESESHPFRMVHVSSADTVLSNRLAPILTKAYSYFKNFPPSIRTLTTHLQLPGVIVGPFVPDYREQEQQPHDTSQLQKIPALFVEDAVAAVFQAFQLQQDQPPQHEQEQELDQRQKKPMIRVMTANLATDNLMSLEDWKNKLDAYEQGNMYDARIVQTLEWTDDQSDPFRKFVRTSAAQYTKGANKVAKYQDTFGLTGSLFPCSSSCRTAAYPCKASAFDRIRPVSHSVTRGCENVVYLSLLTRKLKDIVQPGNLQNAICRVAFVSAKSKLVESILSSDPLKYNGTDTLTKWNGKIKYNGWDLVWLPNHSESTLSDADNALLRIDPSGMFDPSVQKAMYVEDMRFAYTGDFTLLKIMGHLDRQKYPKRKVKEIRSGTSITRQLYRPPEAARQSIMFVSEPQGIDLPTTVPEFLQLAGPNYHFPAKQILYYYHASHYVQNGLMRPESEIRTTKYKKFPFQWLSLSLLVHDLRMEESRQLRCRWYDEYMFWGGNRDAEEFSLGYVLGKMRIDGTLGAQLQEDGGETSWSPLLVKNGNVIEEEDENEPPERKVDEPSGAQVFIRIIPNRKKDERSQQRDVQQEQEEKVESENEDGETVKEGEKEGGGEKVEDKEKEEGETEGGGEKEEGET